MLINEIQNFIDEKIDTVPNVNGKWTDIFKPKEKKNTNQVIVRSVDRIDNRNLKGDNISSEFTFQIFVMGNNNRETSRDFSEQVYNSLNNIYNLDYNANLRIVICQSSNYSFQFEDENNSLVGKFNLRIVANDLTI
jgi:hypothetical protein